MKILFVCTGNTCRSPMAEYLMKDICPQVDSVSAGTSAAAGDPASQNALSVMKEWGIDMSGFTSQPISFELLNSADKIVAIGFHNAMYLKSLGYEAELFDLPDPYCGDIEVYRNCRDKIKEKINDFCTQNQIG